MKNIVYIFCDELRQDALGCYGNPAGKMYTPNIDSIAQDGCLFENCYCNSPVCVPSRTSLLTGLYPEDTGVYGNEAMVPRFHMDEVPVTFPEVLAQAGYATANFGKIHIPRQMMPFQTCDKTGGEMTLGLPKEEIAGLKTFHTREGIPFNAGSLYPEGKEYYPEMVTENAIRWMREQDGPFFVRVSYLQPHTPIIVKRGYERIYQDYPFTGALPELGSLSAFERTFAKAVRLETMPEEERRLAKIYYYGMVCWIDDEVGKLLTWLKENGLYDNTVIVVNADHGALRGECGGLGKHLFQRASHAVPLIFADPEKPKGVRRKDICSNIDLARTLLASVGVEAPDQFKGCDLFRDKQEAVYATIGYGESTSDAFPNKKHGRLSDTEAWPRRSCIRTERYRLDMSVRINGVYTAEENEDLFFVDCLRCPEENINMAEWEEYVPTVHRLREMLLKHCARPKEVDPATIIIEKPLAGG